MECNKTWPDNREFISDFNRRSAERRIPVSGGIDLTHRCNLRCVHCYLGGDAGSPKSEGTEMNTGHILSLIDELTEAGCLFLLMTGGEPLLRKDFPEIYRRAKTNGMIVTVFTNGTLITDTVAGLFDELPPRTVEISLYGASKATYESITGIPGSYDQCLKGIKILSERKIPLAIKTILMTANRHEFFEIQDLARALGVKFRFDAALFPCTDGSRYPLSLRVPPEEAVEKDFSDKDRYRHWKNYFEMVKDQQPDDRLFQCGAGTTGFHIDASGGLKPCLMTAHMQLDLSDRTFLEGWAEITSRVGRKKIGAANRCGKCAKIQLCGYCPAFFEMETGSENVCSEYLCSIGNHRFRAISNTHPEGVLHAV